MDFAYRNLAPSFATLKFLEDEFKRGRTNLNDNERSGRPKMIIFNDNTEIVHQIIIGSY